MNIFSKYTRLYKFDKHVLIYNTINGEIVILPLDGIVDNAISECLNKDIQEYMYKKYFFVRELPWGKFEDRFESNNRLLISLETFLSCNLSCPYCYQINNNHLKTIISHRNLDLLFDYISQVYQKVHYDILSLKVLGGEPSLDWSPADYLLQNIIPFCKSNSIRLDLRIDTNCTNIKQFTAISEYDSLLFTIPLCFKEQHNKYRHYQNGQGTYDEILKNVAILREIPNCQIVLRHNTDASNVVFFDDYLADISSKGLNSVTIMPQFTTNPDYGEYKNQLTYQQYVDWLSSECINSLVRHSFKVPLYPRLMLDGKCQQWSSYSLKLFSDGKVGACAAHFFDQDNPYLSDIMEQGFESIKTFWNATKSVKLFHDSKCRKCSSFFGCSSHYKLPCINELNLPKCKPEESLYLNWNLYFRTLYKHILDGRKEFFPGIKINQWP